MSESSRHSLTVHEGFTFIGSMELSRVPPTAMSNVSGGCIKIILAQ